MRYGIVTANLGDHADPRVAVRLARAAEAAGWEAYFVWDHLGFVRGVPSGDPWVILSAVAASTMHLMLGLAITPLARRRPQVVANALASLDLLSGGRVVFGAGLGGDPEEFTAFGEPGDAMRRAAMLDEGVQVLGGLWSGETVTHRGKHYAVGGVSLAPRPLQRPRVPIWIGGVGAPACAEPPAGTVGSLPQRAPTGPRPWPKAPDGSPRWWPKSEGTGPRTHPSRWPSTGTRSPALPRLRSGGGDLVARKHPRRAGYARRDAGAGEGGPAGGRMKSSNAAGWTWLRNPLWLTRATSRMRLTRPTCGLYGPQ